MHGHVDVGSADAPCCAVLQGVLWGGLLLRVQWDEERFLGDRLVVLDVVLDERLHLRLGLRRLSRG